MHGLWTAVIEPIINPGASLLKDAGENAEIIPHQADAFLRQLESWLRKQPVQSHQSGNRKTAFKGQGLDFSELRQYMPGDDIRKMDWQVFARTLTPHVREYHEERQWTIWLAADLTPSLFFGSGLYRLDKTHTLISGKAKQLLTVAGLIGLLAQQDNSQLGFYLFSGTQSVILKPKSGEAQLHQGMHALLKLIASPITTQVQADHVFSHHCNELTRLIPKQAATFFLSDFYISEPGWENCLGELSRKSALYSIFLRDQADQSLPPQAGWLPVADPESRMTGDLDCAHPQTRQAYTQATQAYHQYVSAQLQKMGHVATLSTTDNPLHALSTLVRL